MTDAKPSSGTQDDLGEGAGSPRMMAHMTIIGKNLAAKVKTGITILVLVKIV
jgi:hypothetical protein